MSAESVAQGVREVCHLGRRAKQVWGLVPLLQRCILGFASFLMAITSAANTLIALLLGQMVDRVERFSQAGEEHSLFEAVGGILSTLIVIYLARELLHVVRRNLVEQVCTRIN